MQTSAAAVLSVSLNVAAVCTAGNPNAAVAEATPSSAFVDHGDGTLTHYLTGLMWKRCVQGTSGAGCTTGTPTETTWKSALAAAVAENTAGHTDWRLPNKKELESIVETCGSDPMINTAIFGATPLHRAHWSSTTYRTNATQAYALNFSVGVTVSELKLAPGIARLVRRGDRADAFDAAYPAQADIDGNGTADALTDGLLLLRYLFGLRGAPLIQNAIGPGAQRKTSPEIEAYLQSIVPK